MSLYNEGELQAAIADGERKLAVKRQQRRSEKRRFIAVVVALAVVLPLCVLAGAVASRAPSAPSLVVTWPKPKVRQVLAPGQTLVARSGQPFSISVTDEESWEVVWEAAGIQSGGREFTWAPSAETGELIASCQPLASDWQRFFIRLWPTRRISLKTISARKTGDYGRILEAGSGGAWVYPHIFASGTVGFDERALPLLASAIPLIPVNELSSQLATTKEEPTPRLWQLVTDFEGKPSAPDAVPNDTFASLHATDLDAVMPTIAANIVKASPDSSIKFILRLDKDPKEGILRLAFDGKGERRAWVRRPGESSGGPFTGWEGGEDKTKLLPSLPGN